MKTISDVEWAKMEKAVAGFLGGDIERARKLIAELPKAGYAVIPVLRPTDSLSPSGQIVRAESVR